ncbi:DEAD/DEAH box helicase [Streptomyces coeruleorubidus]|uniref:DEAD/DEAH box helicase n=1 Tax=Streptomyces coeruleorubidus TaxID=116188 RepID=UPI0037ABCB38
MADNSENSPSPASSAALPRPLYWLKTNDPDYALPELPGDTDVRVMLPEGERFRAAGERLTAHGAKTHTVKYWMEQELVSDITPDGAAGELSVRTGTAFPAAGRRGKPTARTGAEAVVARDAFEALWQSQVPESGSPSGGMAAEIVPESWLDFLPHQSLNPAQAQAAPQVLQGDGHTLVVAPTGAGKTAMGMLAALRAILREGRKAAWLVPQRSLTDELDRELAGWRRQGLRVERLSGEYSIDVERVREADLWVTTTEKFEVLCRTSSLREALAEVGCLIIDEVHLLGDPERGPVLEAVLTRVRGEGSHMRLVGLSATVSNAEQVAEWLGARLVRIAWRPSRLTWQLPVIPVFADRGAAQAARTRVVNALVDMVTADHGSVLVFCGSKFSVRSTALAIVNHRGVPTAGVRPDDSERLRQVCDAAGIGLHYKDWEHKREAEQAFRERRTDVLVATSTVAAGVNLPARAVVVRDTRIGTQDVDVATVQQMFGRAGRLGAGESAGWAFMVVDQAELAEWQRKLVGGYTVESQISASLPDHVLAEVVQGRIRSTAQAEQWWLDTFAHHQGSRSTEPVRTALDFLKGAGYCTETDDGSAIAPTELGALTTRVMMPAYTGFHLRTALSRCPVPADAEEAEETLIGLVSTVVPKLAKAPVDENLRPAVAALLQVRGRLSREHPGSAVGEDLNNPYTPGDLARAALLTVANSPWVFPRPGREIGGIPFSALRSVLQDAPRYLHWLGSQGFLGTLHPWACIVAADLNRRIRWRRCAPERGSGRLLWMCERMATPLYAEEHVPDLWDAARRAGLTHPDWPTQTPPRGNRLDGPSYANLLRERVTPEELDAQDGTEPVVRPSSGRVLCVWNGRSYSAAALRRGPQEYDFPPPYAEDAEPCRTGVALFSWRGDYRATGWLADYSAAAPASTTSSRRPPHQRQAFATSGDHGVVPSAATR